MHSNRTKRRWRHRLRISAATIVAASMALVDLVAAANTTSDPNPITRQLEEQKRSKRRSASPPLRRPAPAVYGAESSGPAFQLRSVSIAGSTVVPEPELKEQLTAYIGRLIGPAELTAIATRLSDLYQRKGYFLSRATIDPQDVADGHLRIRMIEGHVKDVRLEGGNLDRFRLIEAFAPITAERPLSLARFERTLLLISDTPGLRVLDTALDEDPTEAGAYRLTVSVAAEPLSAALTVDNRTADGLASVQAFGSGALTSVLLPRDEVSIATATTTRGPGELTFVGGAYEVPLGLSGLIVGAFGSRSILAPRDERRLVDTETRSNVAGVKVGYAVLRSLDQTFRLTMAFTETRTEETTVSGRTYRDAVNSLTVGADYQVIDRFGGVNVFQLTARQGLDLGRANERWDVESSRYDGSGVFTKAALFASRYQPIDDLWFARASVVAQISADPLLSSEQFYLGGGQFGRAYHSSEFNGDHGVALALEAGMILPWRDELIRRTEVFGFVDGGLVGFRGRELDGYSSIMSVGTGVRSVFGEHHSAQIELALPVDIGSIDDHGAAVYFSITSAIQGCGFGLAC